MEGIGRGGGKCSLGGRGVGVAGVSKWEGKKAGSMVCLTLVYYLKREWAGEELGQGLCGGLDHGW